MALLNAGGTALTGAATITVSGFSGKNRLYVLVSGASSASASSQMKLRFNADTGVAYTYTSVGAFGAGVWATSNLGDTGYLIGQMGNGAADAVGAHIFVVNASGSNIKTISSASYATGGTTQISISGQGTYAGSATITSVSIVSLTGNFDAGTIYVYGG